MTGWARACRWSVGWLFVLTCALAARGGESMDEYEVVGREERRGVLWVRVRSAFQEGETVVRFLAPAKLALPAERRVLFVLPVEPKLKSRFGDGLATVRKLRVPERYGFVAVAPTFRDWPWYCDHPTDKTRRQETYVLKVVVPLTAKLYPHEAEHRGLLGFSKSGWGAFTLLLRNPESFAAAVAWDAPLMMRKPRYEMARLCGGQDGFEAYRVARLLEDRAEAVRDRKRLAHFGYGNFRSHHEQAHALMRRLGIPHDYADGPQRRHHWDGGWVDDAARMLDRLLR
ncbi:MAG: alpha/beta hydrolase-fold protein [Planctomycetota bacterium]